MMNDKLEFWLCEVYKEEVQTILHTRQWTEFQLHLLPQSCLLPQLQNKQELHLRQIKTDPLNHILLMGACYNGFRQQVADQIPTCLNCMSRCFDMIANPTLVDYLVSQGAYVLTPGWLESWQKKIKAWGFDQKTAREFFQECARKFVLLDTGVNPDSKKNLQNFSDYLGLPAEILPIGLEYLDLYLTNIFLEWQRKGIQTKSETIKTEYDRQVADNAMALDLLTQLARTLNEDAAITDIIELFKMFFSPGKITYSPVRNGKLVQPAVDATSQETVLELFSDFLGEESDYRWSNDGEGFILRLSYQDQTVGLISLENLRMPQYKERYLNLSLSIAQLCGLVIENTRMYQKLRAAESDSRHEKEISDTLRQIVSELSSHLKVEDVLGQFLRSIFRVIPCDEAVIYRINQSGQMEFSLGLSTDNEGALAPYIPKILTIEDGAGLINTLPGLLADAAGHPEISRYFLSGDRHAWLGLPIYERNRLSSYLTMTSQRVGAFDSRSSALAESIVKETSFAIENAQRFSEVQAMAITDSLTGLFNRRHFYNLAEQEFKRAVRYQHPLSLILADIDFFKKINDTYSHSTGDEVLISVSTCIKQVIRGSDILGRFGGEEFIILLPETDLEKGINLAERVRIKVSELTTVMKGEEIKVTLSLGISSLEPGITSVEDLIRLSDEALYKAKNSGRNCSFSLKKDLKKYSQPDLI